MRQRRSGEELYGARETAQETARRAVPPYLSVIPHGSVLATGMEVERPLPVEHAILEGADVLRAVRELKLTLAVEPAAVLLALVLRVAGERRDGRRG